LTATVLPGVGASYHVVELNLFFCYLSFSVNFL
jgi:hypothetical protein